MKLFSATTQDGSSLNLGPAEYISALVPKSTDEAEVGQVEKLSLQDQIKEILISGKICYYLLVLYYVTFTLFRYIIYSIYTKDRKYILRKHTFFPTFLKFLFFLVSMILINFFYYCTVVKKR